VSVCRAQHKLRVHVQCVCTVQSGIGNCESSATAVEGIVCLNAVKPSGYYMYRQFNIQKFYVLIPYIIYVLCVDLRTNSYYFHIQHKMTGFYKRDLTL